MTGLPPSDRPPSLAQIGAHLLNSTFIDSLEGDIEQLQRMNQIGQLVAPEVRRAAEEAELTERHVRALLRLENSAQQLQAVEKVRSEPVSYTHLGVGGRPPHPTL